MSKDVCQKMLLNDIEKWCLKMMEIYVKFCHIELCRNLLTILLDISDESCYNKLCGFCRNLSNDSLNNFHI